MAGGMLPNFDMHLTRSSSTIGTVTVPLSEFGGAQVYGVSCGVCVLAAPLVALAINASFASFNCSDIIGIVFDDQNKNGFHDPSERGLPGVGIATVNGVWVVTDRLGRFSLPCALIPGRFGSSFILKLDPRSLPAGYQVTTHNPVWLRATAGRVHVVGFGATD